MKTIEISTNENFKSEITVQKSISNNLENFFDTKKAFLITNTTLKKLYPDIIKKFDKNRVIIIKDGEKYKNFKTANYIINQLLKENIERKDTVVAFGGGVVGDLAAFCASNVLRGVNLIQIPTTLLSMCDSSIGGKTGYNTKFGKNLIGTFYLANKVLIDTTFLKTLNDYEFKCGLGEILKYAFIEKSCKCDEFFNLLELFENKTVDEIRNDIEHIVTCCIALKAAVVNKDRLEGGLRKILNFGHTYAHAIETISNYKGISHGASVAYGIKLAGKLALNLNKIDENYFKRMDNLLNKFNLIDEKFLKQKKFNKQKIVEIMKHDKKVVNGKINLLLAIEPAVVELFDNIDLPLIEASLP